VDTERKTEEGKEKKKGKKGKGKEKKMNRNKIMKGNGARWPSG